MFFRSSEFDHDTFLLIFHALPLLVLKLVTFTSIKLFSHFYIFMKEKFSKYHNYFLVFNFPPFPSFLFYSKLFFHKSHPSIYSH